MRQTAPIIPHYAAAGILRTVDGMADIDEVSRQIDAVLRALSRTEDLGVLTKI